MEKVRFFGKSKVWLFGASVLLLGACKTTRHTMSDVVIFGNSIVAHAPNSEIGWHGDWGMAASSRDSDFVHVLMAKIQQSDTSAKVRYANIADFERDFQNYDLKQLDEYRNADMYVVKLSENVDSLKAYQDDFIGYYDQLLQYLSQDEQCKKIVVDGFWPNAINHELRKYAEDKEYDFVSIEDLYMSDKTNSAKGLFEHEGVANHPSDQGMRQIANRIWKVVARYF